MNDVLCDFLCGVGAVCVLLAFIYAMPYILKPGLIVIGGLAFIAVGNTIRREI